MYNVDLCIGVSVCLSAGTSFFFPLEHNELFRMLSVLLLIRIGTFSQSLKKLGYFMIIFEMYNISG